MFAGELKILVAQVKGTGNTALASVVHANCLRLGRHRVEQ